MLGNALTRESVLPKSLNVDKERVSVTLPEIVNKIIKLEHIVIRI